MNAQTELWLKATTELLKLTNEDKLRWTALRPSDDKADDAIGESAIVFTACFEGKNLRLRRVQRKIRQSMYDSLSNALSGGESLVVTDYLLEICDPDDVAVWPVPSSLVVSDLYNAVAYKASGASALLDEILKSMESSSTEGRTVGSGSR